MFIPVNEPVNQMPKVKPDNLVDNASQEGLGGHLEKSI
jgi:hypothetical protein